MIVPLLARPRISAAGLIVSGVAALVALGCTSPSSSAVPASSPPSAATTTGWEVIRVLDFKLDPSTIRHTGTTLTLQVVNDGPTVHNVKIRDASGTVLMGSRDLREGESEVVSGTLPDPGTYTFFCSLPGHESLGIKGTLEVE